MEVSEGLPVSRDTFSTVFSTVRGVSLTIATPIVRYSEPFLQAARSLGASAVSVVRNLEVVRYSGAAITLYLYIFQLVHIAVSAIR